jgi:hypothetical protein
MIAKKRPNTENRNCRAPVRKWIIYALLAPRGQKPLDLETMQRTLPAAGSLCKTRPVTVINQFSAAWVGVVGLGLNASIET